MSGVESPPSFEWFISFGNILTIIISTGAIIGAIVTLIRYLRQNVTRSVVELKEDVTRDLGHLTEKVASHERATNDGLQQNKERIEEIKWMMMQIERRIDETRNDTHKTMEQRSEEVQELVRKLDQLREEQHKLAIEQAKRMDENKQY